MRRLLTLVSLIVLVDVAFYTAITPLLPTYVDDLDLTKGQAGVLAGSYAAGTLVASLPAGLLASRWGAKRTVLLSLAAMAVSCMAFGFGEAFGVLASARFVQGIAGAGAWAAGLAWLVAAAPPGRRGALIGTALGVGVAGALGGPILGTIAQATSTELVFSTVAAVAAALAFAVIATPPPPPSAEAHGVRRALTDTRVLSGVWLTALPATFFGAFSVLTPLRLDDLGATAAGVGAVFLGAAAIEATIAPIVGRVSDHRGRLVPMRIGLAGMVVAALALPHPAVIWLLVIVALATAAMVGSIFAPAMALLSDSAEAAEVPQGLAFGFMNLAWAGGQVAGAIGGSRLAEATTDAVPYAVSAALAAATLAALLTRRYTSTPRASRAASSAARS